MKPKQQKPSTPKTKLEATLLFAKLLKESKSMDEAWRRVRKMFPRKQWGKVREITQKLSAFKTFMAAWNAAHLKSRAKMSLRKAA